jgi:hypothetical protein
MSSSLQTILAIAVVALAAAGLIWRSVSKRASHGCGCPPDKFKKGLKDRPR